MSTRYQRQQRWLLECLLYARIEKQYSLETEENFKVVKNGWAALPNSFLSKKQTMKNKFGWIREKKNISSIFKVVC